MKTMAKVLKHFLIEFNFSFQNVRIYRTEYLHKALVSASEASEL